MSKSSFDAWADEYIKFVKESVNKAYKEAIALTYEEYFKKVEEKVMSIFNNAIHSFYSSYSPLVYNRNYSLYKLIEIDRGKNYIEINFIPENMSGYRNGYSGEEGLYDKVFRKGWHGGADHGDYTHLSNGLVIRTPHPETGSPYWRVPIPYYTSWGDKAAVTEPPLNEIKRAISDFEKREKQKLFNEIWNKNKNNIKLNL